MFKSYYEQYLSRLRHFDTEIGRKIIKLEELKEQANGISAIEAGEKVQSSSEYDKIGGLIAKIVDLETEINEMIGNYTVQRKEVKSVFKKLDNPRQEKALTLIYLDGRTIHDTAKSLNVSDQAVKKMRNRAIHNLDSLENHKM